MHRNWLADSDHLQPSACHSVPQVGDNFHPLVRLTVQSDSQEEEEEEVRIIVRDIQKLLETETYIQNLLHSSAGMASFEEINPYKIGKRSLPFCRSISHNFSNEVKQLF